MANIDVSNLNNAPQSLLAKVTHLRRCCDRIQANVGKETRLSDAQCTALQAMPEIGTLSTGELCRTMGLSASRGGRVIEELVQANLMERVTDPHDRRINRMTLTARGLEQQRKLKTLLGHCEALILSHLSPEEYGAMQSGLDLVIEALENL